MKLFLIVLMAMALGACSTVGGLGKDITATAEWSKEKMSGDEDQY
jgi:predicted small secreted protein